MFRLNRYNRQKEYLKYTMPFARVISYDSKSIVLNKDGSIQTSFKYRGPDLDSAIMEQLAIMTQQLNQIFSALNTGWIMYFEAQRSASVSYADDVYFPDVVTRAIDEERRAFFSNGKHFESNYYATIYYMPPSDNEGRMKEFVVEGRKHKEITAEDNIDVFCKQTDKIFGIFQSLRIPVEYLTNDETLTYLHSCVSDNMKYIKMPQKDLLVDQFLYDTPLYGGLEPRIGKSHVRVIVPLKYPSATIFGLFNRLNQLDFSYRWITRFYCLSKRDAISALGTIKSGWNGKIRSLRSMAKELILGQESDNNINENAQMKFDEVKDAINATEQDITNYGYYSTSVIVMDKDPDVADTKAKVVEQTFVNLGLNAKIESLNSVDAFFGCIPGNVGHNVRRPMISCGNLVHMMPISDIWAGPSRNEHLSGPPLIYTQTTGNTPFRLSLHVKDVGHTFLVGPTGAGKSVHLNMIAAQFRKYKNSKVFIFDKGSSSIALTFGVGGNFFDLGNEDGSMSFQPLADVNIDKEKQWALEWLCDYARSENYKITPESKKFILDALNVLASYPTKLRTMTTFVSSVQDKDLRTVFTSLTNSGTYGKIFDSNKDSLTFSSWQTFEMEKLMQNKAIVGPTLMYIFHKIENMLRDNTDNGPTYIDLDEAWVFLDNEQFSKKIREWLKVLRKMNASVVFATQSVSDIVSSPIFATVLESCPSQIFLPNDKAIEKDLKEKYAAFGLNQRQIEIIANAIPKKQYYYVSPLGCRLYDLALEYCPFTLSYVGVSSADVKKCHQIIKEFGQEHFNDEWLKYKNISSDFINEKEEDEA